MMPANAHTSKRFTRKHISSKHISLLVAYGRLQASLERNFGKEVAFLNQIAAIAIIFITENILFTTLNVFRHFHQALF